MLKWILISLAIGGYLGMWILAAWLLMRWDDDYIDPAFAALGGFLWPALLATLILFSPFMLVGYIAEHMPRKGDEDGDDDDDDDDEDDEAFVTVYFDDENALAAAEEVLGAEE